MPLSWYRKIDVEAFEGLKTMYALFTDACLVSYVAWKTYIYRRRVMNYDLRGFNGKIILDHYKETSLEANEAYNDNLIVFKRCDYELQNKML